MSWHAAARADNAARMAARDVAHTASDVVLADGRGACHQDATIPASFSPPWRRRQRCHNWARSRQLGVTGNNLVLPFPSAALDDLLQVEQIMVDDGLLGEVRR
jgi:hypothetical protein